MPEYDGYHGVLAHVKAKAMYYHSLNIYQRVAENHDHDTQGVQRTIYFH